MSPEPAPVFTAARVATAIRRGAPWLRAVVLVVAGVTYALLAYRAASRPVPAVTPVVLGFAPLLALVLWPVWRSRQRIWLLLLLALGAVLLWKQFDLLVHHYRWAYLIQHAGSMVLFGCMFGRTLLPGHEPMISRFARQVHGSLSTRLQRYTRGVTWAWTLFFTCMALASLLLFALAPAPTWALFAEVLTPLLVLALFAVEYLVRVLMLPPDERAGPIESVRAFARYRAASLRGDRGPRRRDTV